MRNKSNERNIIPRKAEATKAAEPELPKAWKPKVGTFYYYINSMDNVANSGWVNDTADISRYESGNVYKTRETAEFEAERRKVEFELRRYIYEHGGGNGEFVDGENNYYLCYNQIINAFNILSAICIRTADIFCNSRDILRDAINAIGEDRIKKYYLRVKE